MNHVRRVRPLTSVTRRAMALLGCHAVLPAAAVIPRFEPSRWPGYSTRPAPARMIVTGQPRVGARPPAPRERLRTRVLPARLPHTVQLCIHCQERPAGFWVSRTGAQAVRRPWCLSCCEALGCECRVIPFGG